MSRIPVLLLLAGAASFAGCDKAESLPPLAPAAYPITVGNRWTYESGLKLKVVRAVERTVREGPYRYAEMTFHLPFIGKRRLLMRNAEGGIAARQGNKEQVILRLPMRIGGEWRIDFPGEDLAVCRVEGEEGLDVLGKRLRATRVRVLRTNRKSGKTTTDYEWYAEGIGLVRMRVTFLGVAQTFDLISYETAP